MKPKTLNELEQNWRSWMWNLFSIKVKIIKIVSVEVKISLKIGNDQKKKYIFRYRTTSKAEVVGRNRKDCRGRWKDISMFAVAEEVDSIWPRRGHHAASNQWNSSAVGDATAALQSIWFAGLIRLWPITNPISFSIYFQGKKTKQFSIKRYVSRPARLLIHFAWFASNSTLKWCRTSVKFDLNRPAISFRFDSENPTSV